MKKLFLAIAAATAFTQPAIAQDAEGEAYCAHLLSEIAIMQQTVSGLSSLLNTNTYTLVSCNIDPNLPATMSRDQCLEAPEAMGHWVDYETQTFYVVYPKDYIRDYAQTIGASSSSLQRSFEASDRVSEKIRGGDVIPSLQVEISNWQAEYARACAGSSEAGTSGGGGNCLLGVCP